MNKTFLIPESDTRFQSAWYKSYKLQTIFRQDAWRN